MTLNEILWAVVIAAALALEGAGLLNRRDKWLPLTEYIKKYVPKALILAGIVWLAVHFDVVMH
jgi:hypothetical protein